MLRLLVVSLYIASAYSMGGIEDNTNSIAQQFYGSYIFLYAWPAPNGVFPNCLQVDYGPLAYPYKEPYTCSCVNDDSFDFALLEQTTKFEKRALLLDLQDPFNDSPEAMVLRVPEIMKNRCECTPFEFKTHLAFLRTIKNDCIMHYEYINKRITAWLMCPEVIPFYELLEFVDVHTEMKASDGKWVCDPEKMFSFPKLSPNATTSSTTTEAHGIAG